MRSETSSASASATAAVVPLTKFRAPRLRRDTVRRDAVLARALPLAQEARLVLAQAPAGFGKTTLLVQLTAALAREHGLDVVWVSLDTEDNDANRLFAAICTALAPMQLPWSLPPAAWLSQLQEAGPHCRAALGPLLNALAGQPGQGIALVLDDLHHVNDPGALALLDAFIDRLPPEARLFIGSRETPALSLARWRAGGELVELDFRDLQFDATAAASLRELRGLAQVSDEQLQAALARTHGWPAGLQLLLGHAHEPGSLPSLIGPAAHRHLFDYFAQEVLAELPASLQDFLLHCAVLAELSPPLCQAITGRDDAAFVLDGLYRRQLFLIALDEAVPVLRLHDLFRDFLLRELDQRQPGLAKELHARAARSEPRPLRAVPHLLAGQRWDEAVQRILQAAPALLAESAHETVQRWINQLPEDTRSQHPELHELLGHCAWASYLYPEAEARLRLAAQGYQARGTADDLRRLHGVQLLRAGALISMGALDEGTRLLQACEGLPSDHRTRLNVGGPSTWLAGALAPRTELLPALQGLVEAVEEAVAQRQPELLVPAINDLYNDFFYDLPGSRPLWLRLRAACARAAAEGPVHWQVLMQASNAWPEFWHGERAALLPALDRQAAVRESLSHLPATWLDALGTQEIQAMLAGDLHRAVQRMQAGVAALGQPPLDTLSASWKRPIQFRVARLMWHAQDAEGLARLEVDMQVPRTPAEWPFVDGGRQLMLGRLALLRDRLDEAEPLLRAAVAGYERFRLTSQTGDPRIDLAWLHWRRGEQGQAWAALEPVWDECLLADAIGPWLLQPPCVREPLLTLMPPAWARRPGMAVLLTRLQGWAQPPGQAAASAARSGDRHTDADEQRLGLVASLSEREREVLALMAEGQSNKLIARALGLSPHTVKRHVANILTKLVLDSRTQAAAFWHRR
jgi:LuxR family transcriptional regulator, maltose regulon positive regulatory protein